MFGLDNDMAFISLPKHVAKQSNDPLSLGDNRYNKVKGCLSVLKDLANRRTGMVLLYRVVSHWGRGKVYNYFGGGYSRALNTKKKERINHQVRLLEYLALTTAPAGKNKLKCLNIGMVIDSHKYSTK